MSANNVATICLELHTRFHFETTSKLNYEELGISPGQCPAPGQAHDDREGDDERDDE